ncbi:MAG: hypothetical protein WA459_22915 [Stellaceae bacterium]
MNDREHKREKRKQNRLERLAESFGKNCFVCGESDPNCLQSHHIAGRKFGDDQITVCLNHHQKLSDWQDEHPPTVQSKSPSPAECMGRLLLGIADCLELIKVPEIFVELLRRCGTVLIENEGFFSPAPGGAKP